ncbi:phenylacetaldoxime dehydratase family protein [Agarilytica rhodophyticola]|uniref:phenylacetaldoxime dehydratase family protein n=1 Tax=Agarilytica rhodophyticola TaxID=1737490 RepID=UPI000B34856E|nr:phenylacetaldoxime dehydratase family protein [Agarilytica rhodophyticola]
MPRNNMPPNWQPPAPAWCAQWDKNSDPLVVAYFAIQADSPDKLDAWAETALYRQNPPARIEKGAYTDQADVKNYLYICYWQQSEYLAWWANPKHCTWWSDPQRCNDGVGYWREVITMPLDRFETLNSSTEPHGVSAVAKTLTGPIEEHGYPGGMRDRIALSDHHDLKNSRDMNRKMPAVVSDKGKRVVVTPPENTCVIRSGQNWSYCEGEQKKFYLEEVHPVLKKGMQFLRDNPVDSGCYCLRFVDLKESDNTNKWNNTSQTFGLGYASDIHAFEEWAKSHPTHIAILENFMRMVGTFGENLKLKLWHEVTVLPKEGCEFEYIACHNNTGLLNYSQ